MRNFGRITVAALAAVVGLLPAFAEAQPVYPPPAGPGWHRPGPGPGPVVGPGPGLHRPPPGPGWRHPRPYYRDDSDAGAAVAAGVIGLAAGAIIAGAASGQGHVERCLNRYRSYDPDSDTFIGNDGRAHRCRL